MQPMNGDSTPSAHSSGAARGRRTAPRALAWLAVAALAAAAASPAMADDAPARPLEGAIGLVLSNGPEYAGASRRSWDLVPAGFIRYGRFSLSGAGGFSTRRNEDVERGAAASLMERDTLRVSLGLSADSGRRESSSERLRGMGDIEGTLRASLRLRWRPDRNWAFTTGLNVDALGRGSGWWLFGGASRSWSLGPDTSLTAGMSLRWAGSSYLQRRFGVTPAQSEATGYEVYTPGAGFTDLGADLRLRTEFGPRWGGFAGVGASWQLGPAVRSPLVDRRLGVSLSGGLVWRF